jgi:hypothetical protein
MEGIAGHLKRRLQGSSDPHGMIPVGRTGSNVAKAFWAKHTNIVGLDYSRLDPLFGDLFYFKGSCLLGDLTCKESRYVISAVVRSVEIGFHTEILLLSIIALDNLVIWDTPER